MAERLGTKRADLSVCRSAALMAEPKDSLSAASLG